MVPLTATGTRAYNNDDSEDAVALNRVERLERRITAASIVIMGSGTLLLVVILMVRGF